MANTSYEVTIPNPRAIGLVRENLLGDGFLGKIAGLPIKVFNVLLVWQDRATQRAHLAQLPDYLLADMGMTPEEARRESAKYFWRA